MRNKPHLLRLLKVLRRSCWRDWLLFSEALWTLGLARFAVLLVPFRSLAARFGEGSAAARANQVALPTVRRVRRVHRVSLALRYAASVTPWRSKCLEKAIAGQMLLRRRGLPGSLHLGVAKNGTVLQAHAWLRCGDHLVTGGQGLQRYAVVARFGEPSG